ncbi:TetR family transcriptional regulator [Paraburkholderia sp. BL18I3N2]|uniref:TetR/AcrR family transcriptional regulator n=1 Tax=Paraburkholderia sp. BL18I3N2 TaxID=1938799 RepID=UPI000D04D1E2|nr:TetR/AcrR family transcriptional regulator [Paraburkholderia sp. BL18I3N2]PRX21197.1 TetR family transcriptional regulator [Paraburkholderia sp. BL18I3N2]
MRASKRQLVVDKATVLFSKHGFQAVGVDWIIDDSGVARMTLYRHFSGKDDLIREVLLQRYALIIGSIEVRLQGLEVPEERVKAIFDWYGDWFATPEFAGCLFERALAEFGTEYPKVSGVAIQYRDKMTSWMAELLGDLMPAPDAKHLGEVFMMLLDGATVTARAANDPTPASQAWAAAEVLLRSTKT